MTSTVENAGPRKAPIAPGYLGPDDAASYLGVSRWMIDRVISEGRLTARRLGRRVLIKVSDLDSLLEPANV